MGYVWDTYGIRIGRAPNLLPAWTLRNRCRNRIPNRMRCCRLLGAAGEECAAVFFASAHRYLYLRHVSKAVPLRYHAECGQCEQESTGVLFVRANPSNRVQSNFSMRQRFRAMPEPGPGYRLHWIISHDVVFWLRASLRTLTCRYGHASVSLRCPTEHFSRQEDDFLASSTELPIGLRIGSERREVSASDPAASNYLLLGANYNRLTIFCQGAKKHPGLIQSFLRQADVKKCPGCVSSREGHCGNPSFGRMCSIVQ